jgi:hypothetical protein
MRVEKPPRCCCNRSWYVRLRQNAMLPDQVLTTRDGQPRSRFNQDRPPPSTASCRQKNATDQAEGIAAISVVAVQGHSGGNDVTVSTPTFGPLFSVGIRRRGRPSVFVLVLEATPPKRRQSPGVSLCDGEDYERDVSNTEPPECRKHELTTSRAAPTGDPE